MSDIPQEPQGGQADLQATVNFLGTRTVRETFRRPGCGDESIDVMVVDCDVMHGGIRMQLTTRLPVSPTQGANWHWIEAAMERLKRDEPLVGSRLSCEKVEEQARSFAAFVLPVAVRLLQARGWRIQPEPVQRWFKLEPSDPSRDGFIVFLAESLEERDLPAIVPPVVVDLPHALLRQRPCMECLGCRSWRARLVGAAPGTTPASPVEPTQEQAPAPSAGAVVIPPDPAANGRG